VQVQARLSNAKYQQTIAENALIKDKERLNLLMGRSVDAEFEVDPDSDLSAELPTQAEAVATALRLRPDLKEAQLQIERDDLERRAKKAEYIPDVSLHAAYVNLAGSGLPIGGSGYAEVGLQLRWEPFDWGRKSHEIAEKTAVVTQARLAATEAQSKVRIDVSSALRDVQAATQLLGSAHLDEQAAEESLRVVQAKYGQRAALLDEVLKAQSACAQAHLEVSRARTTIRTNRALLSKAIGEDL
jgi:outer membrane protein TolC